MAIKRSQALFLLALALVAALIVILALRNRAAPWLPNDSEHATFSGADRCLTCHDRQGPVPQSERHPVGRDCLRCHATSTRK